MKRAFTLIELLVVVAIIGLLVAILTPALGRAREIARRTACRTNLHAIGVGVRMYLDQNGGCLPVAAELPSSGLSSNPPIVEVLLKQAPSREAFHCPSDRPRHYFDAAGTGQFQTYFQSEGSSYEYNSIFSGLQGDRMKGRGADAKIPIIYDYEPFHGPAGLEGSANFLFLDGHVGDFSN